MSRAYFHNVNFNPHNFKSGLSKWPPTGRAYFHDLKKKSPPKNQKWPFKLSANGQGIFSWFFQKNCQFFPQNFKSSLSKCPPKGRAYFHDFFKKTFPNKMWKAAFQNGRQLAGHIFFWRIMKKMTGQNMILHHPPPSLLPPHSLSHQLQAAH